MKSSNFAFSVSVLIFLLSSRSIQAQKTATEISNARNGSEMDWVRVSDDKRGFVLVKSGRPFIPWGFNYDHDENGRLIEDYWDSEWNKVEEDFREMKQLGANVVRIHLQLARFMRTANEPNEENLKQYARLVALAKRLQMRLDVTGLGCYHKKDVPDWYDELDEEGRWAVQARFWEAISAQARKVQPFSAMI